MSDAKSDPIEILDNFKTLIEDDFFIDNPNGRDITEALTEVVQSYEALQSELDNLKAENAKLKDPSEVQFCCDQCGNMMFRLEALEKLEKAKAEVGALERKLKIATEYLDWIIAQEWSRHYNIDGICNEALQKIKETK